MEDNKIDQVIANLSKIESTAVNVKQEAEKEKANYNKQIEEKIKAFDEKLAEETKKELEELSESLESKHQKELTEMRANILEDVAVIEKNFNEKHQVWAKEIFEQIIKE